jgi:ribonucleoside-diphosphate reductase alpha chain
MNKSQSILSDVTVFTKYAKFIPELERRETWEEIVNRNMNMHIKKFPILKDEIKDAYKYVYSKKILPSMRSMQFAGKPIEINPVRIFNCSYLPVDDWRAFSEIMFLLLSGTGVGFSVQNHHIEKLPDIKKPNLKRKRRFLVSDNIEGWADAIKVLMKSYFYSGPRIEFDFSDIRPKGAMLITSGGKAPGPDPLKLCLVKIESLLNNKDENSKLTSLEVHDIVCHIADAVLAGGIRRAALISLFSADDEQMISCKTGNWWELNSQRGRANNSAVLLRNKISKDKFLNLWDKIKNSGSGEPGIYFTNDKDWGTNPCVEISLRPFQFCNLVEINASNIESEEDFISRSKAASFIGTLQASYTDFHYLRPIWQKTTEKDALLGVSMTGIASMKVFKYNIERAVEEIKLENKRVANLIEINSSARLTAVKPAGTTSLVLGTSSGIHAWHNKYYIRRLRLGKNESIYNYLKNVVPELVEDEFFRPTEQAVLSIPQEAPEGAVTRHETSIDLLERVKEISLRWVKPGHIDGQNTHNVSATVSIDKNRIYRSGTDPYLELDEWQVVGEWMWNNKEIYNGLSVLPYDGGTYVQAPFEDITKELYDKMSTNLKSIDLSKVKELADNTDLQGELACAGGSCEII